MNKCKNCYWFFPWLKCCHVMFGFTDAVRTNLCTASATNRMVEEKMKSWLLCQERDRDGGRKRRFFSSRWTVGKKNTTGFADWLWRYIVTMTACHRAMPNKEWASCPLCIACSPFVDMLLFIAVLLSCIWLRFQSLCVQIIRWLYCCK